MFLSRFLLLTSLVASTVNAFSPLATPSGVNTVLKVRDKFGDQSKNQNVIEQTIWQNSCVELIPFLQENLSLDILQKKEEDTY
jgi:hypothetical protein